MTKPTLMDAHKAAVEAGKVHAVVGLADRVLAEAFVEAAASFEAAEATFAARCAETEAELERLRAALRSIANNTCCGPCQEAAMVARAAMLKELEP